MPSEMEESLLCIDVLDNQDFDPMSISLSLLKAEAVDICVLEGWEEVE